MPIHENQEFPDFKSFKIAMQDWALTNPMRFSFRYQRSDRKRNVVICVHETCPFRVNATFSAVKECVVVVSVKEDHNCIGSAIVPRGPSSQQSWIQRILPTTISVTKSTSPQQIIDAIALHHKVSINYDAAKKAKRLVLGDDMVDQARQFALLPAYMERIQHADPLAHCRLSVEDREGTNRFQRLFICPGVSRAAFQASHHLIAMDSTFTKEIFNLTILLAVSVNADNHSVLLAWAVVEGESEHSWRYFLSNLLLSISVRTRARGAPNFPGPRAKSPPRPAPRGGAGHLSDQAGQGRASFLAPRLIPCSGAPLFTKSCLVHCWYFIAYLPIAAFFLQF